MNTAFFPKRVLITGLLIVSSLPVHGRNEWLSARTGDGRTTPISLEALKSPLAPRAGFPVVGGATAVVAATPVLFDLTMSISDDAAGDNNGNTQGNDPGSAEQDQWERIVQHFADGIFEMTEGAHKIRRVRIFRKGRSAKGADVVWTEKGRPHVPAGGGVGEPGGRVNLFKIFTGGAGGGVDKDMLADEIGSGYTMAHEWGAYFYGLYGEDKKTATQVAVSPSIMSSQWNATGGNKDWLNFSIKFNGGGPFQNTKLTRQHEVHEASGWETLARSPSDDPNPGSLGKRVHYPELAGVAPTGSNPPRIDLPSAAARDALDIIWADRLLLEIVIDNSASMAGAPLQTAKAAAKLLVDRAEVGEARIGVAKFSSTATVVSAVTDISGEAVKATIKNSIDAIAAEGDTAIGDAAVLGLAQVQGAGVAGDTRVVFLLSDGTNTTGSAPLAAIPGYQAAQVPLFTFAFGLDADAATLRAMAVQTGGKFYVSPTSLNAITLAFQDAFSTANSDPVLTQGAFSASATKETLIKFPVDSGLAVLAANVVFPQGSANAALVAPDKTRFAPTSTSDTGTETLAHFHLPNPLPGIWQVAAQGTAGPAEVSFQVDGAAEGDALGLTAYSVEGAAVSFPHPILLRAKLGGTRPVAGAFVKASATAPDGTTFPVKLTDDGKAPDDLPNDGTYSGYFYYTQTGHYEFTVQMDNSKKRARFTSIGEVVSPSIDGEVLPTRLDEKIAEGFVRTARFGVTTAAGFFAAEANQLPKGTYAGLFAGPGGEHRRSGAIFLTLGARGAFSGKLYFAGETFILTGKLNANGGFAIHLLRKGNAPLQFNMQVDAIGSGLLTGAIREGGFRIEFTANLKSSTKANPTRHAGNFTALIMPDALADPALTPVAAGFATGSITADGLVRFTGRLADGTVMTGASAITDASEIPIYAGLYHKAGSVFGTMLAKQELGVGDFEGTLRWFKPMSTGDPLYPDGFETSPTLVGSAYPKLAKGQRVLGVVHQDGNVDLELSGGGFGAAQTQRVTLESAGNLIPQGANPLELKLTVKAASGLLGGSFIHPVTHLKTNLSGAILVTQNLAGGFFLGPQRSGDLLLRRVVPAGTTQAHVSTDVPLEIPDPDPVTGPVEVASGVAVVQAGTVVDLALSIEITHSYRGDLKISLRAPSGRTVLIKKAVLNGSEDDLMLTALAVPGLLNEAASGTWELLLQDEVKADTGMLKNWSLEITTR